MASLVVRDLDDDLVHRLNERARAAGRSPEAELRLILEEALRPHSSGRKLWERLSRGERTEIDFGGSLDQASGPNPFE